MQTLWICLAVAAGLAILLLGFGCLLSVFSMGIKRQTLEQARAWQEAHYDLSWYDPLEKESYTVKSWDGYPLYVELLRNPEPSERYVLISHGYTDNRFGALKYAKNYLDLGFHVLVYDLRGHGVNPKTHCTYTVRERRDLNALILDSRSRYPDAKVFGLHGESLGGAASIACLELRPPVDFVVDDCGFSEIRSILQAGLRSMRLPGWLTGLSGLCTRLLYGCSYEQMRPIDSLAGDHTPILILHGEKDDFILPAHAEAFHAAAPDHSELHIIPGATHAASVLTQPAEYRQYLETFLRNHGCLE